MKVLVTGANGQLGRALREVLAGATFMDSSQLDVTDATAVEELKFDVIINTAGYTAVDQAEQDVISAWRVNAIAPTLLAQVAKKNDAIFVHISSDYVYDGTASEHSEDELLKPLNVYGASKAGGDFGVSLAPKHYIVRTSWVVGDGANFVRTMLSLGKTKDELSVVNDQIGRLSFATDLAKAINHLLEAKPEFGVYHASNSGQPASWADIARKIFQIAELDVTVNGISTKEYAKDKQPFAPRPKNSVLNLDKIEASGYHAPDWEQALKRYIEKEQL